jgi:muramoyltetrapeptide carboxypeptidase
MAELIKHKRLRPGSNIAIVAPAGPPKSEQLKRGAALLKKHGYNIKIYPQVHKKRGYLAGDDKIRAEALMDAFADRSIDAIFAARGGFGCQRILPFLDFDIIKANPKPLVGYSDLTIMLLSVFHKCGFVTFHGPMTEVDFGKRPSRFEVDLFFKTLESAEPIGIIPKAPNYRYGAISGGVAEGEIVGGNISLINKLVGTGFLPSFKDKIVFLEDTEEQPYRIDGYLAHIFLGTDLSDAAGFIIGEITKSEPKKKSESLSLKQVLRDYFADIGKPVLTGYACAHGKEKITIPIGIRVAIDADKRTLEFLEAGVV